MTRSTGAPLVSALENGLHRRFGRACQKQVLAAQSTGEAEANCDPYSQCVLSDAGIVGDAHSDCIGTGGANPESSEIHSTGPSWMPDACASTSALRRASGPRRLERIAA